MFWGLDKKLAQRKHFPSVNWLISYSKYTKALEPFYEKFDTEFVQFRAVFKEVLQKEDELNEIVQLVRRRVCHVLWSGGHRAAGCHGLRCPTASMSALTHSCNGSSRCCSPCLQCTLSTTNPALQHTCQHSMVAILLTVLPARCCPQVGKDALAETDKITLETARFIKDDYLQQNSFTKYDKYCPFYKTVGMMRNISAFHRLATAAVEKTAGGNAEGARITYNVIKQRLGDVLYKLTAQKFEDPADGETSVRAKLKEVYDELHDRFRALEEEFR